MKRTIIAASIAALPFLLGISAARAEPPEAQSNIDASKMPESGPLVVGGTGQTTGPNSKNQAITPMPGMRRRAERAATGDHDHDAGRHVPPLRTPQPRR